MDNVPYSFYGPMPEATFFATFFGIYDGELLCL